MKRIIIIESCDECPNFDNEYYSYMETCDELHRPVESDEDGKRAIPEDCPLEKEDKLKETD